MSANPASTLRLPPLSRQERHDRHRANSKRYNDFLKEIFPTTKGTIEERCDQIAQKGNTANPPIVSSRGGKLLLLSVLTALKRQGIYKPPKVGSSRSKPKPTVKKRPGKPQKTEKGLTYAQRAAEQLAWMKANFNPGAENQRAALEWMARKAKQENRKNLRGKPMKPNGIREVLVHNGLLKPKPRNYRRPRETKQSQAAPHTTEGLLRATLESLKRDSEQQTKGIRELKDKIQKLEKETAKLVAENAKLTDANSKAVATLNGKH